MTDAGVNWTDERVELLKKLWTDGLSASQIAAELGNVTRNAVIGKVHRLGLSGRAKDKAAAAAAPPQGRPRSERARRRSRRRTAATWSWRRFRARPSMQRSRRSPSRTTSASRCRSA